MSFYAALSYSAILKEKKRIELKSSVTSITSNSENNSLKTVHSNNTLGFDGGSSTHSFDEFVSKVNLQLSNIHSNYNLTKMDTRHSQDTPINQYRVSLSLSKPEMELVRYTWNRMLLDDTPTIARGARSSSPALPGGFPSDDEEEEPRTIKETPVSYDNQSSTSGTAKMIKAKSSAIATSLFCRQFYSNLLSRDPELEKMFPSIKHQAVSFAAVLSLAVMQLEDLSSLEDYLSKLGKRHTRILNIEPVHYELMGEALIQTFHERFGNKFNQELEILWIKLYLYLANTILQFGIDPTMKYDQQRISSTNAAYSSLTSRRSSMAFDDVNSQFDEGRSLFTQSTSVSSHMMQQSYKSEPTRSNLGRSTSPMPSMAPPIHSHSMITPISRATTSSHVQPRHPPPPPPPPPPVASPPPVLSQSDKKTKSKRKRDCVIM
ncbi:putative globin-like protein [Spathaspora sp. JA1]|nr:putative globin-like protein [Spathaspora sp. JA1]